MPAALVALSVTELANAGDLFTNGFAVVQGSVLIAIRSAPSTAINLGLDGPEPGPDDGADTLEVAVVPVPSPSFSCPANTPVTVTISAWTKTLAAAFPSPVGAGGGGGGLMDAREISPSAPATMATISGAPNPSVIGGTNGSPQTQFLGIYADLPFLTYITAIDAVRRNSGTAVQSHYEIQVPSITVAYDDATCTAPSVEPAKAVPAPRNDYCCV